jgi:3-oxoacyl-(acyl-carrier-protein) synthase
MDHDVTKSGLSNETAVRSQVESSNDTGGQVRAIRAALDWAGIGPAALEAAALREALGEHGERVPVSTTKAQLGHLMGATAGVEVAATLLALRDGLLPACQNLDDPDPRCPLNFVRGEPRAVPVRVALKYVRLRRHVLCGGPGSMSEVVRLRAART